MKKLWMLITVFPTFLFGSILFDPHMSPHAASEDLLFLFNSLEKGEDRLIPVDYKKRHPEISTWGRAIELVAWGTFDGLGSVTIHEVFGHGYRIRSLGEQKAQVTGYVVTPDSGGTSFSIYPNLTTIEYTAITVAGIEAQEVLAECVKKHWFLDGYADARQGRLYTMSRLTPFLYASLDHIWMEDGIFSSHDIKSYVAELNLLYPGHHYTQAQIRNRSLFNLIDPTLYNSFYSFFKYLIKGDNAPLWSIPIGSFRYIPSVTTYLAPYGVEYGILNFLKHENDLYYFYIKGGQMGNRQYGGAGIELMPLIRTEQADIGLCVDVWRQPLLKTPSITVWLQETPAFTPLGKDRWGGRLGANFAINLTKSKAFQLIIQPGIKTGGYLPGYSLVGGTYIRGGAKLSY
ncbi:MAG: hypothetical protein KBC64_05985 [Simkaniaceae bacterium]|nr:hypothetical protein [Simkaniaceae bacterium]